MRVLVTGATGFIGYHVAHRFAQAGDDVTVLVRPPAARFRMKGVEVLEGDLGDPLGVSALEALKPDVVCHLAADTRMDASAEEMEENVRAVKAITQALGDRLKGARFLFASSIAAVDRVRKPKGPLTRADAPAPRSAYARSKLECERVLAEEAGLKGFHLSILRLATIYGPGQEKGGLVTLADAVRSGGLMARIPWTGRISFCLVTDVAEVFYRLANLYEPGAGTFFVSEDRGYTMAEAAVALGEVTGAGKPRRLPIPRFLLKTANFFMWLPVIRSFAPWSLRAALDDTILCDSRPIRELTGIEWTSFGEGLARTFSADRLPRAPSFANKPVRSLVTGATGYLGRALAHELAAAHGPESVVGLVREPLPEAEREAAESLRSAGVRLVPADLMTQPATDPSGVEFDVLYHLAAETDSGASPEQLVVNTEGTRNLLETFGPRLARKRVVLAGATAAIDRASRPKSLMAENDPPSPRTPYGVSKLMAERTLDVAARKFGFAYAVPRFSPIWTTDLSTGFLKAFKEQVVGGSILRKVGWPGRVTMVRREDAVKILRHLGEGGAGDGKAVNVGDGEVYPYADLLRDIRAMTGDEGGFLPMPRFVWAAIRWFAWLPVLRKFVPWRLSCLLGDDLAVDTTLLRSLHPEPPLTWEASRAEIRIDPPDGQAAP